MATVQGEGEEADSAVVVDVVPLQVVTEQSGSPPSSSSTPRAFKIPLPVPLRLLTPPDNNTTTTSSSSPVTDLSRAKVELVTAEQIVSNYAALSKSCATHGPRFTVVRGKGGAVARWLALPGVLTVAFASAVLALVLTLVANGEVDNASLPLGGYWPFNNSLRTLATVLLQTMIEGGNDMYILYAVFQQFPLVSRRPGVCTAILGFMSVRFMLYLLSKIHWMTSQQRLIAKTFAFVPGYWLSFTLPFIISRQYWIWWKRSNGKPTHPQCWWAGMRKPSGVFNILANIAIVFSSAAFMLLLWDVLGMLAFALIGIIFVISIAALVWSLTKRIEFSAGHAMGIPVMWNIAYVLSSFLKMFMEADIGYSGPIWTAAKFFAFYLIFGAVFSFFQAIVSLATTSFESPQYLVQLQLFLETAIGLAFVSIQSTQAFWLTLALQSIWALFQNTGLKADIYMMARDFAVRCFIHRDPIHTEDELLRRLQYFFQLNMQGILCDIINATILPIIFLIDNALGGKVWGLCTVSCGLSPDLLRTQVLRYIIVLGFRLVAASIVTSTYLFRFWRMLKRSGSNPSIGSILHSMLASFQLHVLRNLVFFSAFLAYIFGVFVPSPFIVSSSSSLSS